MTTTPTALERMVARAGFESWNELSEASSLSLKTIYNLRHGYGEPRLGTLVLLAQALKREPKDVRRALKRFGRKP